MLKHNSMPFFLKELHVKNFKCFKSEQKISFEKLTLLTGANSSGKSSVLHAILGALQSGEFPFKFSTNGKYFNMGDFTQISNKHTAKEIILGLTFKHTSMYTECEFHIKTTWSNNRINHLPELKMLNFDSPFFSLTIKKEKGYFLDFMYNPLKDPEYSPENERKYLQHQLKRFASTQRLQTDATSNKVNYKKEAEIYKKLIETTYKKVSFKRFPISDIENLYEEIKKKKNIRLEYTVDGILNTMCKDFDNTINAISSFRLHPERTYLEQSKDELKIQKFGEGYLDQILQWEKYNKDKFNQLKETMRDMGLTDSISSHRIEGGRYEVHVTTNKNGLKTSLFDVGFGISQFLPIMVADLQLNNNSTLFVAEPEIHLHPNVQAKFGDYLVTKINKNKKNYVIETHSEYLLNRIRLAVVKGKLKEADLSVYYLENNGDDVIVHKITFGKNGQIIGAPKSFFDTYMMDLKDIAFSVKI
jgi:predicted ATPase